MTPAQVEALDDDLYVGFVRAMEREAAEVKKARAKTGR